MARRLKTANCCLTWKMLSNMGEKLKQLSREMLEKNHAGLIFSFKRSESFSINDCENLTGYVVLLTEYAAAPIKLDPAGLNYDAGYTVTALRYGDAKPCLYMEWMHYVGHDNYDCPMRHANQVYGAIYFMELQGLTYYIEQARHVWGGVRPKRFSDKPYRAPAPPKPEPVGRLRHLAVK